MTTEAAPNSIPAISTDLAPMKKTFDLRNPRRQMSLGLVAMLTLVILLVAKIPPNPFWRVDSLFDMNWILDGTQRSMPPTLSLYPFSDHRPDGYHPLFSALVILDEFIFGSNPTGYQVLNLLLIFAGCVVLSLTVFELTGRFGNRLGAGPAIWAGLLYACCPMNYMLAAGDITSLVLMSSALSTSAIFGFLRYQLLRERSFYLASLLCAALALLSNEGAWSLPIVITGFALLIPSKAPVPLGKALVRRTMMLILPYWSVLAVYCIIRNFHHMPLQYDFLGLFVPNNLSIYKTSFCPLPASSIALEDGALIIALLIGRLGLGIASWRIPILLALWLFMACDPSRMPTLPVAPICATIALAALPGIDTGNKSVTVGFAVAGSLLLLVLVVCWTLWTTGMS